MLRSYKRYPRDYIIIHRVSFPLSPCTTTSSSTPDRHSPYQTKGRRNSVKPPLDHIWLFDPIDGPSVSVFPLFPALPILWDNVCVFFGVYSYSHTVGPVVHAADAILQSVAPAFSSGSQTPLSRHFPMPTLSFCM